MIFAMSFHKFYFSKGVVWMDKMLEALKGLITADNIALLSVIVTVLIFIVSRSAEIRYKKRDDIKVQYIKLINLMEKMFSSAHKNDNGEIELSAELKSFFFDTGASLVMYGSKRIYRLYLLFREFATNPLIKQCKYYDSNVVIHIMSEILVTMRKEVGLSCFNSISNNEALAFFINDVSSNPFAKSNAMDAKFRIKMIRLELFIIDRTRILWVKKFYFVFIKPVFGTIKILCKYLVVMPFGKMMIKLFPKFVEKVTQKTLESK